MKKLLGGILSMLTLAFLAAICPGGATVAEGANLPYQGEIIAGPGVAVAETKAGKLQGYLHKGIYTFKGVPYAQANRFQPPQPVDPWPDIRTAMTYGRVSPQPVGAENDNWPPHWYWPYWEPRDYPQSDACQNLNVWTPGLDGKKRPVMVWLHGGAYVVGSSAIEGVYDGDNLSRQGDVVVVSVNHRLGAVGFLDLSAYGEQYRASGNVGMLDIVAALNWVQDNIAHFGGDPGNVTVFGQSGGGGKILTLTAMPEARGLFHKAIVQSGCIELMGMSLPTQEVSRRVAALTLENLGLGAEEVDQLATMPYERLAEAADRAISQAMQEFGPGQMSAMGWSPVVDGEHIVRQPVVDGFSEQAREIPLLLGTVANEFTTFDQWKLMATAQTDNKNTWSEAKARHELQAKYGDKAEDVLAAFRKAYPGRPDAEAIYVDSWFRPLALRTAGLKADQQGAPVYNYLFTWQTPVMGGFAMAYHDSEIPFVFNNIALSGTATGATKEAYALADKMSQAWVNFARTGRPQAKGLPAWPAYTRENGATMILDNHSEVRYHHDDELLELLGQEDK